MSAVSRKIIRIKLSIIAAALIFAAFGFTKFFTAHEKVSASAFGPSPSFTGAPGETSCVACHSSFPVNSGTGNVLISGIPANYLPGQQIPVTVTVNQQNAVIYGFQLTALDSLGNQIGTYTLPSQNPPQTQTALGIVGGNLRTYVHHTLDGTIPTVFGSKSWNFIWNAPSQRVGKISFYASGNGSNSDGSPSGDHIYTTSRSTLSGTAISNFDNDGKSDIAVWRPSNGTWYSLNSTNGNFRAFAFGAAEDKIVPGDYDGDGITDYAVFRPSNGTWYIQRSSGGFTGVAFGAGTDIPVPGDYDGDLKTDVAVYRPSNGTWYILQSSNGAFNFSVFGVSEDKPVPADYDGDGKTDIAVFRPSQGIWYINRSRDGFMGFAFGTATDKPVQGDYDGDGKADVAVYRPSNGTWYIQKSRDGFFGAAFGISTDKPAPADFDGDGKIDIAVLRDGIWYIIRSSDNSFYGVFFGAAEDIPVPAGYLVQ